MIKLKFVSILFKLNSPKIMSSDMEVDESFLTRRRQSRSRSREDRTLFLKVTNLPKNISEHDVCYFFKTIKVKILQFSTDFCISKCDSELDI